MITALLLAASVGIDLAGNPGIAKLENAIPGDRVIYHVRDWHTTKREAFAAVTGFTGDELTREHNKSEAIAATVHKSKLLILAGQPEVVQEALSDTNYPLFAAEVRSLALFHRELRKIGEPEPTHEQKLVRLGAGANLLLDGKTITVIPAEDHDVYEAARPKNGEFNERLGRAREEAIVNRIVKRGKSAILILGGDHDLTDVVKRHRGWGLVKITPKGWPGEKPNQ